MACLSDDHDILNAPVLNIWVILACERWPLKRNIGSIVLNSELLDFHTISSLRATEVLDILIYLSIKAIRPTTVTPSMVAWTNAIMNLNLKVVCGCPGSNVSYIKANDQLKMLLCNVCEVLGQVISVDILSCKLHASTSESILIWC